MQIDMQKLVGANYADYWNCTAMYRVCKGSRGSKKSKTTALNLIYRLIKYPLANAICFRRVGNTLRDSVYADLKWAISQMGLNAYFKCTVSPLEITKIDTGQKIMFRGLDDPFKTTSIAVDKGCICFVWVEEAFQITREEDFDVIDQCIRGNVPDNYFKQITLTFNPWSANSWLKSRFFDNEDPDVFTKTTTWQCNEWLDEVDKKKFLKMKERNPRMYRIAGEGEWGIAEGLIYENVEIKDFNIDNIRTLEGAKACFGLDFGFTDPNAFVCIVIDTNEKIIYVFDEWYQTGVTNKVIAEKIKEMGYGGQEIICDSAEPKSIRELSDLGIRANPSRKGADSVRHGIQMIQNYKIVVHPKCVEFTREIQNYCYEQDKSGRLTDKPDHEFSHGMDAMRYAVNTAVLPDLFSFE